MKSCTVAYFALILAIIFAVHVQAWTVVQHEQVEPSYQEGIVQIVIPRLSYTWNGFAAISSRAITNVEVNYGSLEVREDGLDQTKWNSCGLLPRSEDLGRLFSRKVWVLTPPSDARFREATTVTITYNSRAPEVWEQIKIFVFSTVMTEVFGSGSNQLWVGSEFNGGNVYPVYSQDVAGAVFDSNCNVKNNNALMHFSPFVLYDNARSATFSMPVLCRVVDQDFTFQGLSSLMSLEGYLGQNLFQFHLNEDLRVWPNQCQLDHEEGVAVTLTYDNGLTNGYIWKVLQGTVHIARTRGLSIYIYSTA